MSDHSVPSPTTTTTTTRNRIGSFLTLSSSSPTPSSSTSVANNNNNNNNKRRSIFRRLIPKSKPESECEQESSSPQQRTTRSMSNMSSSGSSSNSGNGEESSLSIVDRLTTKELNQLKEQFKNIDSNCKKNGKISIEEFAKCFGQVIMTTTNATATTTSSVDSPDGSNNNSNNKYSFVQLLFSMFDMDNSGYIDYQEFLLAMTIVIKGDSIDKSKFAFKMLDMNNDGYIEREELRCLVNQMYHFVCDTLCVDPMPFIHHHHHHYDDSSFPSSAQDNVNNDSHELLIDAYADAMFEKMDVSRSGRITLQQLQQFMLPTTEPTAVMALNHTHTDPYCDTSTFNSDDEEDGAEEEEEVEEDSSNSVVDCDASNTTDITNNISSNNNNNSNSNSINSSSGRISSGKHKKKQSGMIPIGFGSSKWKFVLQLQMAIQIACQFTQYRPMVHYIDFSSQIQFQLPLELPTSSTSLHNYNDTRSESNSSLFLEYAPLVFRHIRQMCQVNETEYMDCMGMERVLSNILLGNLSSSFTEKISDGKSGSFFFYSHNEQFMIKTIPTSEFDVLMRILPQYYHHLKTYGTHKTLLMKILACYRFQNQYCIVLANMLPLDEPLSSVYDLKGSSIGRSNPNGFVKKDNDFPQFQKHLWVTNQNKDEVMEQIRVDVAFLQEHQLLDYSLLVGICDHHSNTVEDIDSSEQQQWNTATTRRIVSSDGKQVYYIGIIDLLTEFNDRKKLEFVGKSIVHSMNASKLSVQHPKVYGQRFIEFMEEKVFHAPIN